MKKKTVIVLGKGTLAIRVADWFHTNPNYKLLMIIPGIPEPTWTDSFVAWAKKHDVTFVASGDFSDVNKYTNSSDTVDLAFSIFYDKIIKSWFIKRCKRILNMHNGPLPRYRGVSPINWALKNNESMHGITIHEISEGVDNGPIVAQLTYSIYPQFDEVEDVYKRALAYGWILFEQTMSILDKIEVTPQNEHLATYYSAKQNIFLGERRDFTKRASRGIVSKRI